MSILRPFTEHPASVGESYGQHLRFATGTGTQMIVAGLACFMHGLFPFAFTTTGSQAISRLYRKMSSGQREKVMAGVEARQQSNRQSGMTVAEAGDD